MGCHLCGDPAVAVFLFDEGCACSKEQRQPLCAQHAFKATPCGSMELVEDLTVDDPVLGDCFGKVWMSRQFA